MADIRPVVRRKKPRLPLARAKVTTLASQTGPRRPRPKKTPSLWRGYLIAAAVALLVLGAFYTIRIIGLKKLAAERTQNIYSELQTAQTALKNLDPKTAQKSFQNIDADLKSFYEETSRFGLFNLAKFWGQFIAKVRQVPDTFKNLFNLSGAAIRISSDIAYLKENALALMLNQKGEELTASLQNLQKDLHSLPNYLSPLEDSNFSPNLFSAQLDIYRLENLLSALIGWLNTPLEKHLAIIFENPSEIRPGGGFIGSYADVAMQKGSINRISVHDIYDPDGQLESRIIPPAPLQKITKRWGARDANWFFDFPLSAQKVLHFLNSSKIYQERGTEFEGAIALNVNFINDILKITGPVELADYKLILTSENFLAEVQREVETGEDRTGGEPKKILKVLAPILTSRLGHLDEIQKNQLLAALQERIKMRDIRIYLDDVVLESYLAQFGLAGEVFKLPTDKASDYLAVANANIGGGKTDAVIKQEINLTSEFTLEGKILNTLSIKRTHSGNKEIDPWYRALNQNYLQIFTPLGSKAISVSGRSPWPEETQWDYEGFSLDPDVKPIEAETIFNESLRIDELTQFDKTVFAAWFNTERGKSKTFTFEYELPYNLRFREIIPYGFVFEKQSGVNTSFNLKIEAPPGYIFKEAGKSTFTYSAENPDGRIILDLTLVPLL